LACRAGCGRARAAAAGALTDHISIRVLGAAVAEASGRHAPGRRSLEEAVRFAAPGGDVHWFVDDGRGVAHYLPLVHRASPALVDRVIAAVAEAGGSRPASARPGRAVWQDASG